MKVKSKVVILGKVGFSLQTLRQGQRREAGSEILLLEVILGSIHYNSGVFRVSYSYSIRKIFNCWKHFNYYFKYKP